MNPKHSRSRSYSSIELAYARSHRNTSETGETDLRRSVRTPTAAYACSFLLIYL